MKWIEVDKKLARSGLRAFTGREFLRVTGATPVAGKFLLIRYTKRGLLRRLKRGLYAVANRLPSSWAVANRLYQPSYISLESALSYHGLIPETVYSVTSVTTKSTREFDAAGTNCSFRTIKRRAFCGYRAVEVEGQSVLLAEKPKALADYLYFAYLKKTRINGRLRFKDVDRRDLLGCLAAFEHPGLMEWFKNDLKIADSGTQR